MGVPKFYRWLSERYPLINQAVTAANRAECDNLYLDMNGIVHNCTHGDDDTLQLYLTEAQIFTNIFRYLDKLFALVRPRRLLYMALDGVAPRAKMNQQRQRRFRSAADAAVAVSRARERGEIVGDLLPFDSNQITPGTEFMKSLSDNLKYFIRRKMKEDAAWQRVTVVLSGSEVPGEGEHKIMLFIRNMKMQKSYNPNLRHCLYGLDADLIFLALVSHEPHFFLLREEVLFGQPAKGGGAGGGKLPRKVLKNMDEFQLLHISLLRDYLHLEFSPLASSFHWPGGYDQERLIDDWVFLAYLCGNDFLPHLPTLDIGEGGLDSLFKLYKNSLPDLDGWITEHGKLHVKRLEVILRKMGSMEEQVFQKRLEETRDFEARQSRGRKRVQEIAPDEEFEQDDDMKLLMPPQQSSPSSPLSSSPSPFAEPDTALPPVTQEDTGATIKQRYYHDKFPQFYDAALAASHPELFDTNPAPSTPAEHRRSLVRNYLEGLMWIQRYYYSGVPSWKWYFRYRYAPLASDMTDLADIHVSFKLGQPFRPLEQLLGVLPPASRAFLPPAYRELMVGDSVIADFYPLQFAVDMNGKRNSWEGIALIPFIEERRLLDAVARIDTGRLSVMERLRNVRVGDEYIYEYDPTNRDTYPAALPAFPPITECHSKVSVWTLPSIPLSSSSISQAASLAAVAAVSGITTSHSSSPSSSSPSSSPSPSSSSTSTFLDLHVKPLHEYEALEHLPPPEEGDFVPTVPAGCRRPYPGFPSLLAIKTTSELRAICVNLFGSPSRKETLVLRVADSARSAEEQMAACSAWVGKTVWVEWPYLKEAQVVSVTNGRRKVSGEGSVALSPSLLDAHIRDCRSIVSRQLGSRGVDTGEVRVLVTVRAFTGMGRMEDGSIRKGFTLELTVPAQLIAFSNPAPDPRWVEQPPPTLASAFPIGMTVIYIGPNYYGALATITAHSSTRPGRQQVSLSLIPPTPSPPFGHQIATSSRLQFYPSYMVARALNLHPLVLSKVCSSIHVSPGHADLGLKLRFSKQGMQVPEYARRVDAWIEPQQRRPQQQIANGSAAGAAGPGGGGGGYDSVADSGGSWEYSEKAVALLAAYKKRFPVLFQMLAERPEDFKYSAAMLSKTGSSKEGEEIVQEITGWLTTVGISHLILVPCSSQLMADRGVKAIETESARLHQVYAAQPKKAVTLEHVPLLHLYPPSPPIAWSPTEYETVELGDRVLSVRSDASVPLGLKGTVVGIHGRWCEIVWDEEFVSGNSLNGRCHQLRGQTLACDLFINLSRPKVADIGKRKDKEAANEKAKAALRGKGPAAPTAATGKPAAADSPAAPAAAAAQVKVISMLTASAPAFVPAVATPTGSSPSPVTPPPAAAAPAPSTTTESPRIPSADRPVVSVVEATKERLAMEEKEAQKTAGEADNDLVAVWNKLQQEVKSNDSGQGAAPVPPPPTPASTAIPVQLVSSDPASSDSERASLHLKQLLQVGQPTSSPPQPAVTIPHAEVNDPLASKIAKSKARKAAAAQSVLSSPANVGGLYYGAASAPQPQYLPQQFATFSQPVGLAYPQPPPGALLAIGHAGYYPQPPPPHFYPQFANRGGGGPARGRGGRGGPTSLPRGGRGGGGGAEPPVVSGSPPHAGGEQKKWQSKASAAVSDVTTGNDGA